MDRSDALERLQQVYAIEDPKVIDLCTKRLALTRDELDEIMALPPKTFLDYSTNFALLRRLKPLIRLLSLFDLVPKSTYAKYCGDMARL